MALNHVTSRGRYGKYTQVVLNIIDLLMVNLMFGIALMIDGRHPFRVRELWVLVNVCYLPVIYLVSRTVTRLRAYRLDWVAQCSLLGVLLHAACFLLMMAFLKLHMPLRTLLTFYGLMFVGLPLTWIICRKAIKNFRTRGYNSSPVVIVGINPTSERLEQEINSDAGYGYRILGFFDHSCPEGFEGTYLGNIDKLEDFVKERGIQQIFYTYTDNSNDDLGRAVKIADRTMCDFYFVPRIPRFMNRRFTLNTISTMPVLGVRANPLTLKFNRFTKRAFDIIVSGLFLLFYPLIYIPVAIAIKLSSPGPIYFKQMRTGYRGIPFECYKFRTMRVNANADRCQATQHDPRKTRLGNFLRKTSLDELPQFINVFKGDMSIVGPRPHMLQHTKEYSDLVDRYMARHLVKPGITGWAQVNGYRGLTDELWKMEKRVEYDIWYIENWTMLLDLKIMVRTVLNAIKGEENAF